MTFKISLTVMSALLKVTCSSSMLIASHEYLKGSLATCQVRTKTLEHNVQPNNFSCPLSRLEPMVSVKPLLSLSAAPHWLCARQAVP